ncbi:extracellular solute-binding protein (family 5) [Micromonospora palomenae]|uniref:Extracellular solute-binding protein (Family 5) n=1 Tax=Micromonospora palomenae TaxID=1461247 RepID=A0A561WHV6_9ACTN|nr:extracellular solute-binding protein (family 5) [Micromonospora palomenae]
MVRRCSPPCSARLVDYDEANKPYEVAAESVTSSDNKVWTIKLKDGYTFHNGEKVTAENYIDAWNYGAYAPNGQNSSYFFEKVAGYADLQGEKPAAKTLSGLKKVDDLTFTVTLAEPYSEFKTMLGYTAFYPLPKAAFSAPGVLAEGYEQAPIGQGPFKIKGTWQHDAKVEVEKYDAFPGQQPKVAGVEFRIYQQPTAAYADVLSDNLDVIKTIPTESLSTAATDLGDRFQQSPASSLQVLAFPTFQKEFSKPEVRKAISMAIDRDEITKSIFKDSQQPAVPSSRRSWPATGRTPSARRASSTRPRPRRCTRPRVARPRSSCRTTVTAATRTGSTRPATSSRPTWAWSASAPPRPKFADLLTKLKRAAGRPVPDGLGHGLPVHGELPGPAVQHQRFLELLRLQQPRVRQAAGRGRQGAERGRGDQEVPGGGGTSWPRTCR